MYTDKRKRSFAPPDIARKSHSQDPELPKGLTLQNFFKKDDELQAKRRRDAAAEREVKQKLELEKLEEAKAKETKEAKTADTPQEAPVTTRRIITTPKTETKQETAMSEATNEKKPIADETPKAKTSVEKAPKSSDEETPRNKRWKDNKIDWTYELCLARSKGVQTARAWSSTDQRSYKVACDNGWQRQIIRENQGLPPLEPEEPTERARARVKAREEAVQTRRRKEEAKKLALAMKKEREAERARREAEEVKALRESQAKEKEKEKEAAQKANETTIALSEQLLLKVQLAASFEGLSYEEVLCKILESGVNEKLRAQLAVA